MHTTLKPTLHRGPRRAIVAAALTLVLAACGGEEGAPAALPLTGEPVTAAAAVVESAAAEQIVSQVPTTVAPPTSFVAPTTTTSTAPTTSSTVPAGPAPIEPTITIECATNPPHASVGFGDPEVALNWTVTRIGHPGGTGMPAVVEEWASGTETPVLPLTFDMDPNVIEVVATTTNAAGEQAESRVTVSRYDGCPVSSSLAGRTIDFIDCVSGAFYFVESPREILVNGVPFEDGLTVDSVVVERWNGPSDVLPVSPGGVYWVPGWNGPEEVKAVITYTASDGTHEQHINHWCHGGPFGAALGGDYNVCSDEALYIAHPDRFVSNIDLDGPEGNSCSSFRDPAQDEFVEDSITITRLGTMTLDEAEATLPEHPSFVITDGEFVDPSSGYQPVSGLRKGFERRGFEISAYGETELSPVAKVWFIDVEGQILKVEASFTGLDYIDEMVSSMQFIVQ